MKDSPSLITVHIRDVALDVTVGTRPEERSCSQRIIMNISFDYDGSLAAETDALGHAVDYSELHEKVLRAVSGTSFFLLERLGAFILDLIMEEARIVSARVVLEKAQALTAARVVAVEMSVKRGERTSSSVRCY